MTPKREDWLIQVSRAFRVPAEFILSPTGRRKRQKIKLWRLRTGVKR